MAIEKRPGGSRGARMPPRLVMRALNPLLQRLHRRTGDRTLGNDVLYLTTVGARSGQRRTVPVLRFADDAGGWYVVASFGGAAKHPAWYHNIVAHPDQIWAEASGTTQRVQAEQLEGVQHDEVWKRLVAGYPSFEGYQAKTDRRIPVLRLTPVSGTRE